MPRKRFEVEETPEVIKRDKQRDAMLEKAEKRLTTFLVKRYSIQKADAELTAADVGHLVMRSLFEDAFNLGWTDGMREGAKLAAAVFKK